MGITRIYTLAETAVTIEFDTGISLSANERVLHTMRYLEQNPFKGFREAVPAYSSLAVYFDPLEISMHHPYLQQPVLHLVKELLYKAIGSVTIPQRADEIITTIPVCYEPGFAADLLSVADHCNISPAKVIELHCSHIYHVFFTGFAPGFPYMGISPAKLDVPRKKTPALSVPAGSVALAGRQAGIYPFETPGGWQIIGRTPLKIFDKTANPSCMLAAGNKVRFEPISKNEFAKLHNS
jgi:inhibitor of KinA